MNPIHKSVISQNVSFLVTFILACQLILMQSFMKALKIFLGFPAIKVFIIYSGLRKVMHQINWSVSFQKPKTARDPCFGGVWPFLPQKDNRGKYLRVTNLESKPKK